MEVNGGVQIFFNGSTAPAEPGPLHYRGFIITLRHTTIGRTPLDEGSARLRELYLTTHNTYNRKPSMSLGGFKPQSQQARGHRTTP